MLADLTESGPILEVLGRYCRRCRELAEAEGVDASDGVAVERWLRRRYDASDVDVRSGMEALVLVESDSVSDTLRHLRRKSAIGGLDTEIAYMARDERPREAYAPDEIWDFYHGLVGTFTSGAATYEVRVFLEEPYGEPHFHVRRLRSPRTADVCMAIHRPEYVPHGPDRRGLRPREVADLIGFLESHDDGSWLRMSKWVTVAYCWDDYRDEDRDPSYYADLIMPDYRRLHWPEEDD